MKRITQLATTDQRADPETVQELGSLLSGFRSLESDAQDMASADMIDDEKQRLVDLRSAVIKQFEELGGQIRDDHVQQLEQRNKELEKERDQAVAEKCGCEAKHRGS